MEQDAKVLFRNGNALNLETFSSIDPKIKKKKKKGKRRKPEDIYFCSACE